MTVARPPVVSQTEWDAALAAMTEREETVAAAMHELAAARKRMPMVRVEHDYRFEGPDGQRSLPELFDGRSQLILYRFFFEEGSPAGPTPGASAARPSPTASPSSASCTLATSPSPWRRRRRRRTCAATPSAWAGPTCPGTRSAPSASRPTSGSTSGSASTSSCATATTSTAPTSSSTGAMVQWIGSIWSLWSLTPYGGQSEDEDAPEGWPQAPGSFWFRRHDEFDDPPPSARGGADADDRP